MNLHRSFQALLLAAVTTAAGCEGGPTGGGDLLVVAVVAIDPPGADLIAGQSLQFKAEPRTSGGVPIPGRPTTWSSSNTSVASVGETTGLVTAVGPGGPVTLTARVDGVTGSVPVVVMPVPVASVEVEPASAELIVGQSSDFTAQVLDAEGAPLTGRAVTWVSTSPAVASVSTSGTVSALAPGNTTIRATSEGKSGTAAVQVLPQPAVRLGFLAGPGNGIAGEPLAPPVRVAIQDNAGQTVTAATSTVTLAIADGPAGAVLGGTVSVEAVSGVATFNNLQLNRAGTGYTLRATATALSPALSAAFTIAPGAASGLRLTTQPSPTVASGVAFPRQPVVQLQDAHGNAVAQANVIISVTILSGAPALGGTTTASTNAAGRASFTNLSITGSAGERTLIFAASGMVSVTSNPVVVTTPPAGLQMVTQPSASAESGQPLAQQPAVRLVTQGGDPVNQAGVMVTAAISSGGGTLGGTTQIPTDASGVATFTNLVITGTAGPRTLSFTSPGLGGVTSETINLAGDPPTTQLTITTPPSSSGQSGVALSQQPAIQLRDGGGNPVTTSGVEITAGIASGPDGSPSLSSATATTDASGLATFAGLTITGPAGDYTLRFESGASTPVTSGTITLTVITSNTMIVSTQPSASAQSGVVFGTQPVARVLDADNNNVSGVEVTVGIGSGPAGATLGGTLTATTQNNGRAIFSDLSITGPVGSYTLTFSAEGVSSVSSNTITLSAGPAAQLVITTQPPSSATSGQVLSPQPVIEIRDGFGNLVTAASTEVTATLIQVVGLGSLDGNTKVKAKSGVVEYSNLRISAFLGIGTFRLRFSGGGLPQVTSTNIQISP